MHAGASLTMPATIGNYVIERELGRGGMGAVYAGTHQLIGKRAAIKVLLPQVSHRADLVQRFFNEARAATAIHHPGIVDVYDYGVGADGNAFLVMEYLDGESLASRMKSHGRLAVPTAVWFARLIAFALGAAHRVGIVHRDLKPDNVFLVADPAGERIKLLDFGVAKLVDDAGTAGSVTTTGAILGTPQYMSPEQCEGSRVVDARSDLYSLGCVMFVMLTGRLPFLETGMGGLIGAHLHTPPPPLHDLCPAASPELCAIVARLLAKSPDERFQTGDELAAALSSPAVSAVTPHIPVAETPPAGMPSFATKHTEAPIRPLTQIRKRQMWPWVVVGGLGIAGIVAAVVVTRDDEPADRIETRIEKPVDKPVEPPRPAEVTATQAHLALLRDAIAKQDYSTATDHLGALRDATDAPTKAAVAEIVTAHGGAAITAAAKRICATSKADLDATKRAWAPTTAQERELATAKSKCVFAGTTPPRPQEPNKPPLTPPFPDDTPAITKAFANRNFLGVLRLCSAKRQLPASGLVPCIVSACHLKRPAVARGFIPRTRKLTKTESYQVDRALNDCLDLGVKLTMPGPIETTIEKN